MIVPIFYPVGITEDVFNKKPSDKESIFYKNNQTIQMFIQILKELNSKKFDKIISECSKSNLIKISNEIDSNIDNNYRFTKNFKSLTGLDYVSISKVFNKWKFYSETDKIILIRCSIWEQTINDHEFE